MIVNGRDVLLKIQDDTGFKVIGCNASCTLEITTDTYETTFIDNGAYRGFIPNKHTIVLTGDGPIALDEDVTPADVIVLQLDRTQVYWSFEMTDGTNITVYSGVGYFIHSTITGAVGGGAATCDYTLQVTGSVSISDSAIGDNPNAITVDGIIELINSDGLTIDYQ